MFKLASIAYRLRFYYHGNLRKRKARCYYPGIAGLLLWVTGISDPNGLAGAIPSLNMLLAWTLA